MHHPGPKYLWLPILGWGYLPWMGGGNPPFTGYATCSMPVTFMHKDQGCRQVLEVGGPSGPVTDKYRWPRSNLGGPE